MWFWNGFETEQKAKDFQKERGGILCSKTRNRDYYKDCINFGLNNEKYPFAVVWRERISG